MKANTVTAETTAKTKSTNGDGDHGDGCDHETGSGMDDEDEHEGEDDDEWSAASVRVRAPDRTTGRGSHNPHEGVKLFSELFPDSNGEPEALHVRDWHHIQIKEQKQLCRKVHTGEVSVPEWVMFTKYGMACKVCM